MKHCYKFVFLLIMLGLLTKNSYSQAAKYSNEFLSLGVGARALALSNTVVATSNNVYSAYWNPAGLSAIKTDREFALMHAEYFAGIAKFDYGALAFKVNPNTYGAISLLRFGVDNIPNTSQLIDSDGNINYDNITTFSAADYAVFLSFGSNNDGNFSYGGSVKILRRMAGDFAKSWGFGLDIAAQYKLNNWRFGIIGRDITSSFNAWSYSLDEELRQVFTQTGNEIPENSLEVTLPKMIIGAAYIWNISDKFKLLSEVNVDISTDGRRNVLIPGDPFSIEPHLGLEFGFMDVVFFRAGFGNIQKYYNVENNNEYMMQFNLGLGVKIKDSFQIDYALTDIGNQSIAIYSNVFSIKVNFNKKDRKDSLND